MVISDDLEFTLFLSLSQEEMDLFGERLPGYMFSER